MGIDNKCTDRKRVRVMAKSLQDIEKDFCEQYQQESLQEEGKQSEDKTNEVKQSDGKFSLASDIIFCVALVGIGILAMLLSRDEQNGLSGGIYEFFGDYLEVMLVGFFCLIVVSFVLRFWGNKDKDGV